MGGDSRPAARPRTPHPCFLSARAPPAHASIDLGAFQRMRFKAAKRRHRLRSPPCAVSPGRAVLWARAVHLCTAHTVPPRAGAVKPRQRVLKTSRKKNTYQCK